jgi:hypothetical protein
MALHMPDMTQAMKRIVQTSKPSAVMRRGWSRVPRRLAPNGDPVRIAMAAITPRKITNVA